MHHLGEAGGGGQGDDAAVTAGAHAFDQGVADDTRDWCFAGRVDICDNHRTGVVHAGAEIGEQRFKTCVTVRLDDRDHVASAGLARGFPAPLAISTGWWP